MLKNRIELIEHEIEKLKEKCGKAYFEHIKIGRTDIGGDYYSDLERIAEYRQELEIIRDLIDKGHE